MRLLKRALVLVFRLEHLDHVHIARVAVKGLELQGRPALLRHVQQVNLIQRHAVLLDQGRRRDAQDEGAEVLGTEEHGLGKHRALLEPFGKREGQLPRARVDLLPRLRPRLQVQSHDDVAVLGKLLNEVENHVAEVLRDLPLVQLLRVQLWGDAVVEERDHLVEVRRVHPLVRGQHLEQDVHQR